MSNDYDENDDGQYIDEEDWYNDDFWDGAPSRIYQTSGPMDPEFLRAWRKRIRSIYKPEVMRKLGRDMNNRPLKPQPISDQTLTDPNTTNAMSNGKPPSKWGSYHDGFRMRDYPEDKKDWTAYQWGKHLGVTNLPPSEYLFDRGDDPVPHSQAPNSQGIHLQGGSLEGDNMRSMIPETQYGFTQIADSGQPIEQYQATPKPPLEEVPSTPGNSDLDAEWRQRQDLTHLAVETNENGRDEFYHGGSAKSKMTFSKYGLDMSNNHAKKAFSKLVQAAKEGGGLSEEDERYLNAHSQDLNPSQEVIDRTQALLGPTLVSKKGQQIIEEAINGARKDNETALDLVNRKSLRDRKRNLNPIEQANFGIWSNRTNGLGYTAESWDNGSIKTDRKNMTTKDQLNWIKSQDNFDVTGITDPAKIRNKRNQWKQHLENIVATVERGVRMQIIQPKDNPKESIDALNDALKEAGSQMKLTFTPE